MSGGIVDRLIRLFRTEEEAEQDQASPKPGSAGNRRGRNGGDGEMTRLAGHTDPEVRREVASRRDVRPEILTSLAADPAPEVRCAVAANAATPAQVRRDLADDQSTEVRSVLARRIAHLAPGLTTDEQDRIRRLTYDTLSTLARDQAVRVRRILSETLKDVAGAPPQVIKRLALDTELVVSTPVLEFSPALSDDDLLEIIANAPTTGALAAISRRSNVVAPVADAIALSGDREAIAVLLGNTSAQIREETLDGLIEQAPGVEAWHDPLVHRPNLSSRAVLRLAEFVAENLVDVLTAREDIDSDTARAVSEEVKRRLAAETKESGEQPRKPARPGGTGSGGGERVSPYSQALKMFRSGHLDEQVIAGALSARDYSFVQASLAVRSGLPETVIRRTVAARSAKGLLSLTWKGGLSVHLAERLQRNLARIPPDEVLVAKKGKYPLTKDEMNWQIKFFVSLESQHRPSGGMG